MQVEEPSVQDTIQILRGIADKYASFHGVRIQDRALVAAAELSARYIQGRFCASLPPLLTRKTLMILCLPALIACHLHNLTLLALAEWCVGWLQCRTRR